MATELNVTEDILEGEDMLNLEDLDEKEVLGDDDEEKISTTLVTKQEVDGGDDLYDAAIEPSGAISEKRESAEIQSSLPSSVQEQQQKPIIVKAEHYNSSGGSQQQTGKRYCCYIGNMTWWTTDAELEAVIKGFGIEDLVDTKFYENRNNGQSKGFALAVFASEPSVKLLMEKLPNKKVHDQSLVVLPYTKQSLAKLEEATKRYDQKSGPGGIGGPSTMMNNNKEEKVINIGTVRIGANGAPVQQLMAPINLAQLAARPVMSAPAQQPTSLLSLNFNTPPMGPPGVGRPNPASSIGLVTSGAPGGATMPPGTPSLMGSSADMLAAQQQQHQQQQMAAMAAHQQQQQSAAATALLMQQQQQQQQQAAVAAAAAANQQQQRHIQAATPLNMAQPPPSTAAQQLQQAMSRPPPSLSSLGMTAAAPPSMIMGMPAAHHQMMQPQQQQLQPQQPQQHYRQVGQQMMSTSMPQQQQQQQVIQSAPGFPPGAHINPQVYPGFAHATVGAYGGHVENGAIVSEAEFQEIMSRNQTVSSSAIHRAVSDAAGGDYHSAIETLVTAISLIRQSRVAHDDRCKLLISTLQDTLNGIEAKSYSSSSRKHRRERSRSPLRTKRHRHSRSRSRSRDRGGYEYSPVRHSLSRRY